MILGISLHLGMTAQIAVSVLTLTYISQFADFVKLKTSQNLRNTSISFLFSMGHIFYSVGDMFWLSQSFLHSNPF